MRQRIVDVVLPTLITALAALGLSCSSRAVATADAGVNAEPDDAAIDEATEKRDEGVPEFGPRTVPGRWFAGDFHVHATGASNDAGSESTPERIREVAIARGLDFVVLTDHSNSTGSDTTTTDEDPALFNRGPEFPYWELAAELSDETFLMVDGNEMSPVDDPLSDPTGHIGCYPRSLETFNPNVAFIDRPRGTVISASTVEQARAAGCFVTVNHPFVASYWIAFDWTTRDYDALEVYNGGAGWDQFDYYAVQGWACDLSQGRRVTALGGSDNHRVEIEPPGNLANPPLGWPTTWVWSGALEWPGIIRSLDLGRVNISDTGDPLEIDVYDAARRWVGFAGSMVAASQARTVRLRGALRNSEGEARVAQIVRVARGSCDDRRQPFRLTPPEVAFDVLLEVEIEPEQPFDLHVDVALADGDIVFGWLHPGPSNVIGRHGAAVTNAVHIE